MWEATVRVEREQLVDALPQKVWDLAGSAAALSTFPGWFAFDVPGVVAGTDRLCCLLVSGEGSFRPVADIRRVGCAVVDVKEEIPGQLISWQVRSTEPAGQQAITLSVHPQAAGSAVRIAVSDVVTRNLTAEREPYWHRHVKTWLGCLRAVAEGRAPWPQAVMPAAMQRAMAAPAPLRKPVEASAAVVIDGAPGAVWEAVWDPASDRLIDPERVAWSGHVPGTPLWEAGEMQYSVLRHPGGRFTASVLVVTEPADGHRAVTRGIGQSHKEYVWVITPAPGGTRLELTARWPARVMRGRTDAREMPERIRAQLRRITEGYQALIERPLAPAARPPAAALKPVTHQVRPRWADSCRA